LNFTVAHVSELIDALGEWHLSLLEKLIEFLDGGNIGVEDDLAEVGPGLTVFVKELEILIIIFKIWILVGP